LHYCQFVWDGYGASTLSFFINISNMMMTMVSGAMTVICALFFLGLICHWLMVHKMSRWMHLPGPCTPLLFVFKSLCNSNNVIVWRETYKKYQKVSLEDIGNTSKILIIYKDGICFVPLMNIPLLFVGDFEKLKLLYNHPGAVFNDNLILLIHS
jgi:hypothetical protein